MLKHYAFAFAPSHRARALGWTQDDRVLVVMPLFHVNALCHMTIAMMSAGGVVVLKDRFSASRFWDDVKTHGVTTSSIMQTIPRILLNLPPDPADADTPLRQVVALLPPDVHLEFERRFDVAAIPSYSLTEDLLSVLGPLETSGRKLGSCGVAIAPEVHRLRICNEEGERCAPGELGEIVKQSPAVMTGYYKNPEATAAALRDGWLHTGDLGYLDEDGFLYFVDRKKDMIKRSGENIASAEGGTCLDFPSAHRRVRGGGGGGSHPSGRGQGVHRARSRGFPRDIAAGAGLGVLCRAPGTVQDPALPRLPAGTAENAQFQSAEESPSGRRPVRRHGGSPSRGTRIMSTRNGEAVPLRRLDNEARNG